MYFLSCAAARYGTNPAHITVMGPWATGQKCGPYSTPSGQPQRLDGPSSSFPIAALDMSCQRRREAHFGCPSTPDHMESTGRDTRRKWYSVEELHGHMRLPPQPRFPSHEPPLACFMTRNRRSASRSSHEFVRLLEKARFLAS